MIFQKNFFQKLNDNTKNTSVKRISLATPMNFFLTHPKSREDSQNYSFYLSFKDIVDFDDVL